MKAVSEEDYACFLKVMKQLEENLKFLVLLEYPVNTKFRGLQTVFNDFYHYSNLTLYKISLDDILINPHQVLSDCEAELKELEKLENLERFEAHRNGITNMFKDLSIEHKKQIIEEMKLIAGQR